MNKKPALRSVNTAKNDETSDIDEVQLELLYAKKIASEVFSNVAADIILDVRDLVLVFDDDDEIDEAKTAEMTEALKDCCLRITTKEHQAFDLLKNHPRYLEHFVEVDAAYKLAQAITATVFGDAAGAENRLIEQVQDAVIIFNAKGAVDKKATDMMADALLETYGVCLEIFGEAQADVQTVLRAFENHPVALEMDK